VVQQRGERAKDFAAAIQLKGCELIGDDAGALADIFSTQLISAQIRGFYVDSRNADAPGHDYQVQG
jgi:hypothetical protein